MPESRSRRPLPALICLVVLLLFTAIVWWRVLQRHDAATASKQSHLSASAGTPSKSPSCSAKPVVYPKPATIRVNVYNGSGRNGLASATQTELRKRGFQVPLIDTAGSLSDGVAQIQYGPSGKFAAQLVQIYVPGSKLTPSTRADATLDLVLGKAFTSLAKQAQVDAAVAAAAHHC